MGTLRNSVHLIGRPGADPEIKTVGENKRKLAKFALATNEKYYNERMELIEDTEWHNILAWGKVAENVGKFVRKGRLIAIDGKLQTRQYEDKDKSKRYITEIVVDEFMLIDRLGNEEERNMENK